MSQQARRRTTRPAIAALSAAAVALAACSRAPQQPTPAESPSEVVASVAYGAEVFRNNCANCHGSTGRGDGPSALGTPVKPRDLTAEPYRFVPLSEAQPEVESLVEYIAAGRFETGMPAFSGLLTPSELESVALFVESIRPEPKFIDPEASDGG